MKRSRPTTTSTTGTTARVLTAVAATSSALLLLAGCGNGTAPASSTGAGGSAPAALNGNRSVQFVNPLPNYPAWRAAGDCMAAEAKAKGVEFTETGPTGQAIDATTMIEQVQSAIANRKGAIITLPASDAFTPLLQQAQNAGIVTETFYGTGAAHTGADINVGLDWNELGELYVGEIAKLPGEQKLGLIASADTGLGKAWLDGMEQAAAKTENVEVVGEVYTGDDSAKALAQTNALLTAHGDLTAIATHMGTVTQGAVSALTAKGLAGKLAYLGNGPDNGGREALADGSAYRLLLQDLCTAGKDGLDAALARIDAGRTATDGAAQFIQVGTAMGTKDDLQQYLDEGWH
ncbi:sugar ABC transporter substrate-binding protein [Kineococcus rhizosphaerae]|uniref:Monosaccharide ABC transporter substrate-binding protein (CUT2 family) n=1 Tax=Kineococcus rhizosphaerae TaxID=559628 RepID=A0A2T0R2M5_9ACTN|nr:sugar ABC transporter substrate-binding protein [Kineococcus rhizosphaerae]PRY14021.1 monosaccharide ABC transporter substrate-binding protein (CUT2 family) [Kineococcus rhizosphaerae]